MSSNLGPPPPSLAEKYQTLTPVPPGSLPPGPANYGPPPGLYAAPGHYPAGPPPHAAFMQHGQPPHHVGYLTGYANDIKHHHMKMGCIPEPDSSTPDVRAAVENSFQVPSVSSSTTARGPTGLQVGQPHGPHSDMQLHQNQKQQSQQNHGPVVNMGLVHHPHHPWEQNQQPPGVQANSGAPPPAGSGPGGGHALTQSSSMPGTPGSGDSGEKATKKKRKRCGECPGCLKKDNCGECGPCKSVRSHQICKMRKCDQLKTKKEKVREAAQAQAALAAAQAAQAAAGINTGLGGGKDMSGPGNGIGSESNSPGPRGMNGSGSANIQPQFTNLAGGGPQDTVARNFADYASPKPMFGDVNRNHQPQSQQSSTSYGNYHHGLAGSFNGHGHVLGPEANRVQGPVPMEEGISPADPSNRHQIMNNRLKSLIQSRQSNKGINHSGVQQTGQQTGQQTCFSPGSQQSTTNFTGQSYGVIAQPASGSNSKSSLSPHYMTSTHSDGSSSANSYPQPMSWSSQGSNDQNGETQSPNDKPNERRTSFNSADTQNGLPPYHNAYSYHRGRSTPSEPSHGPYASEGPQGHSQNRQGNMNGQQQYLTSSYSTPTPPSQTQYSSPNDGHQGSPGCHPTRPSSHHSQGDSIASATSPARSKSVDTPVNSNDITGVNSGGTSNGHMSNGLPLPSSGSSQEESIETQPFLLNTTTSMNTYTNIINTYNNMSSPYYTSSSSTTSASSPLSSTASSSSYLLPPPPYGFFGTSSQSVIMTSAGLEPIRSSSMSPSSLSSTAGHDVVGIDCGRILDPVDSIGLNAGSNLDFNSIFLNSTSKSDLTASLVTDSQNSSTTVLPPVSTFLFPNFRDHNSWWGMKSGPSLPGFGIDGTSIGQSIIGKLGDEATGCVDNIVDCNPGETDGGRHHGAQREYSSTTSSNTTSASVAT